MNPKTQKRVLNMKTTLLLVGKTDNKLYAEGIEDYVARTNHYTPFV